MKNLRFQLLLPVVTAETWCIYDTDSGGKQIIGKLSNYRREIASLTKMMTFLVSLQMYQKSYPNEDVLKIIVPEYCTQVSGTTANLKAGDCLSLD